MKLQEAFAAGHPRGLYEAWALKGLGSEDGLYCRLADDRKPSRKRILDIFERPARGGAHGSSRPRVHIERVPGSCAP